MDFSLLICTGHGDTLSWEKHKEKRLASVEDSNAVGDYLCVIPPLPLMKGRKRDESEELLCVFLRDVFFGKRFVCIAERKHLV